jgi:hypothetical protein
MKRASLPGLALLVLTHILIVAIGLSDSTDAERKRRNGFRLIRDP